MRTFLRAVGVAAIVMSAGCEGLGPTQPSGASVPMIRLRTEPYAFTFSSGLDESARLIVRDSAQWEAVWNHIHSHEISMPALPSVDFSREMIVVAALGSRPTGGYNIVLGGASETDSDGTEVIVDSSSPGSECGVTMALTEPVDIALLPLRNGPVSFIERKHVSHCD